MKKKKKDETGKLMDVIDNNDGPASLNNRMRKILRRKLKNVRTGRDA
jgi:hypothetical protein